MIGCWQRHGLSFAALALLIWGGIPACAGSTTDLRTDAMLASNTVTGNHGIIIVPPPGVLTLSPVWSTTDLRTGAPLPSGTTTVNQVQVKWQVGNYWSDGLRIYGLLCTPVSLKPPYPVAILNHGLEIVPTGPNTAVFPAIEAFGMIGCTTMAGNGWLTAITTYRGEEIGVTANEAPGIVLPTNFNATSEGVVELCLGEVDDALNLLTAVTVLPVANTHQVLMWGHSHGSCITERAIERGAPIQVAVSIDGPTDFTTWSNSPFHTTAFAWPRSPAYSGNSPSKLAGVKFLRIHAEGDVVVTPDQGCELAAKIPTIANYYLTGDVTPPGVFWGAPKECSAYTIPWIHGQILPDEVANGHWVSPTFLMYSGLTHVTILIKSWPEFASFANAFTKNQGWHASVPSQVTPLEN
jgi:hypothetical protein